MERPKNLTDKHLKFLDDLRDSGVTNIFRATPYIQDRFPVSYQEAEDILLYWMDTFGEEDR